MYDYFSSMENKEIKINLTSSAKALELVNYTGFIDQTCKQLFKITGLSHFSYVEIDEEGDYFWLGSHDEYLEKCIHHQLVDEAPVSILKTYPKPGFYLVDIYSEKYKQHSMPVFRLLNDFDYGHSFRILEVSKRKRHILKLYSYDAPLGRQDINHFYLNNLDLFRQFNSFFDDKISSIRKDFCKNKIEASKHHEFIHLMKSSIEPQNNLIEKLSDDTNAEIQITPREKEILWWYIKGKTSEETAKILDISRRTIERHFENLREKFGCFSKNQLAMKIIDKI